MVLCPIDSTTGRVKLIVVVHVKHMLKARSDSDYEWIRDILTNVFPVNNLGSLSRCMGCVRM